MALRVFSAAGLIALVLTAAGQGAEQSRPDALFSIKGHITLLAADGNRAAVSTRVKPGCGRIVVWTAPGGTSTRVKPGILGCAGDGVTQLALGSGRVAWLEQGGGNDLEMSLMSAQVGAGAAKEFDFATNGDRAGGDPTGEWLGQLRGAGAVLAYNSWTEVCDKPMDQECGENDPQLRRTNEKLIRLANGRRLVVASGATAYPLSAVGGGRVAVETAGAVTIRTASGAQIAAVPIAGTRARALALTTTRLALERALTLDLYNPATGAAGTSLPLGPFASLGLAGLNSKLALLRGHERLALVRLSDGKRITFPLRLRAATLVGARLTEAGLFYAYNTQSRSQPGRIVFEPTANLVSRF
jgi:hypothetical protein